MAIFNINTVLYKLLNGSTSLRSVFTGEIYIHESPDNINYENITINTLNVSHGMPFTGTSNINIHVPDLLISYNDVEQYVADENRINELTTAVIDILENEIINECNIKITNESILENGQEHYANIRIDWIHSGNFDS